jgi:hypothetical protein
MKFKMDNREGRYNPSTENGSLWEGFASRQRSLVRIQSGFLHQTLGADGIWTNVEFPTSTVDKTIFTGIIGGDMFNSDDNTVSLNVRPLTQAFIDFPASEVGGSAGGSTAEGWINKLRDQTDGSLGFVFRPFFGNTSTGLTSGGFEVTATTINYVGLDSSGAKDLEDKNCWQIVEKLGEAENFAPRITRDGKFRFSGKSPADATVQFQFHGLGSKDREFGHTIKKISRFGPKHSNFYSKVQVKFASSDTTSAIVSTSASFVVNGVNNPYNLGHRTFTIENNFIQSTASAQSIAAQAFTELSALKREIEFTSSFTPQLELLDIISITYDSTAHKAQNLWDNNNWDNSAGGLATLIWDESRGDAINLLDTEFKILSIEQDLDKFETKIIGRES